MPKKKHEWFVLRVLYGHTKDVVDAFINAPMQEIISITEQELKQKAEQKETIKIITSLIYRQPYVQLKDIFGWQQEWDNLR